MIVFVTIYK